MLLVSVYLCFSLDIWNDEVFTLGAVSGSYSQMMEILAKDVHPPLYYILLKPFVDFLKDPVIAMKLFSVLPGWIFLILGLTFLRKRMGLLPSGLFVFCAVSMPNLPEYLVEGRMYTFAALFLTLELIFGLEMLRNVEFFKFLALTTLFAVCACYTQYFTAVGAAFLFGYFLIVLWIQRKKEALYVLAAGVLCIVCYLPWLLGPFVAQITEVAGNYWIEPVTLRSFLGCAKYLFTPSYNHENLSFFAWFALVWVFALFLTQFLYNRNKEKKSEGILAFTAGWIPVVTTAVFGIVFSILKSPIFVYRYLVPAIPAIYYGLSVLVKDCQMEFATEMTGKGINRDSLQADERAEAVRKIDNRRLGARAIALLFLFLIGITNFRAHYGNEMWKRVQFEESSALLKQFPEDAVFIMNFNHVQALMGYYLPNQSYLWYDTQNPLLSQMYPMMHPLVPGEFTDEEGISNIKELLSGNAPVYFFGSGASREEIVEKWKSEGISVSEPQSALFERYWINLYSLTIP